MSTVKFNTWQNTDGTENYKCRAWVNFESNVSPIVIRGSGNVTSITDHNTGDYTVNFTTAMPDANYALSGVSGRQGTSSEPFVGFRDNVTAPASGSVRIFNCGNNGTFYDSDRVTVAIFR